MLLSKFYAGSTFLPTVCICLYCFLTTSCSFSFYYSDWENEMPEVASLYKMSTKPPSASTGVVVNDRNARNYISFICKDKVIRKGYVLSDAEKKEVFDPVNIVKYFTSKKDSGMVLTSTTKIRTSIAALHRSQFPNASHKQSWDGDNDTGNPAFHPNVTSIISTFPTKKKAKELISTFGVTLPAVDCPDAAHNNANILGASTTTIAVLPTASTDTTIVLPVVSTTKMHCRRHYISHVLGKKIREDYALSPSEMQLCLDLTKVIHFFQCKKG